jgi:hypothetical protein
MRRSIIAYVVVGLGLLLGGCVCGRTTGGSTPGVIADVVFAHPAAETLDKISIERFAWNDIDVRASATLPRRFSETARRVVIEERADTMLPPPWTTRLHILPAPDARKGVRIEFREHATYGVGHAWVNEKLLFVRVWWGRIAASDCVLDVESLRLIYAQDVSFLGAIHPLDSASGE